MKRKTRARHPIVDGMKVCAECLKNKPVAEYNWNDEENGYIKNLCKPCHSASAYMSQLKNKLRRNPNKYWECSCGWVNPNKESICLKCKK